MTRISTHGLGWWVWLGAGCGADWKELAIEEVRIHQKWAAFWQRHLVRPSSRRCVFRWSVWALTYTGVGVQENTAAAPTPPPESILSPLRADTGTPFPVFCFHGR